MGQLQPNASSTKRFLAIVKFVLIFCFLFVAGDMLTAVFFFPPVGPTIRPANLYYHHGLPESTTQIEIWGGKQVEITTNAIGLRDSIKRDVPAKSNKHRVLFLGDSMVEGEGVPEKATFPVVFATIATDRGIPFEVMNGGIASHSPTLYYYHLLYLAEIRKVQFDEVFVFLDSSDPQDDIFYRRFVPRDYCFLISRRLESFLSRYSATFQTFLTHSARKPIEAALRPFCAIFGFVSPNPLRSYVPTRDSPPLSDLLSSLDKRFSSVEGLLPWEAGPDVWPTGFMNERFRWVYDDQIASRWANQGVELNRFYLDKIASYLRNKGIPLWFVIYPNPYNLREGTPKSYVNYWSRFAAERNIRFVSLFDADIFNGNDPKKIIKNLYIDQDVHWNEAGHRAVAKELFSLWHQRQGRETSSLNASK